MPCDIAKKSVALQSTGGLQLILQQTTLRRKFREFIELKWEPVASGATSYYLQNARNIAMNFLDLWIDIRDFCKLRDSPFRSFRAVHIFEKYLMHGAERSVQMLHLSATI